MRFLLFLCAILTWPIPAKAQSVLLEPDAVFDGTTDQLNRGWVVLIRQGRIQAVGPRSDISVPEQTRRIDLGGLILMPGLIDAHSHILLHPYDEVSWNDQVLKESFAERSARAVVHLRRSLMAGFTALRDLGSEGAGFTDVGIRTALQKGIIPGPKLIVAGPAIVATGSYGPKGFAPHVGQPLGAVPADGPDLITETRRQIGGGADFIKVYADYRWGPDGEARPTFSLDELKTIVATARSSGRATVAHAGSAEGMRRAALAGVETIEHGDGGTVEIFKLMADRDIAWCPTLAAGEAIARYLGWQKGRDPAPERVLRQRQAFQRAREAGVTICAGSDVGVFPHGENAIELRLMVEYGMTPFEALNAATEVNARIMHMEDEIGRVAVGFAADLIAVRGDPLADINTISDVSFVMQDGAIVAGP